MTRRDFDDETLMRRVDGALSADEEAVVDAAAADDAALAARLRAIRAANGLARDAFPLSADSRDAELARLIRSAGAPRPSLTARLMVDAAATLRQAFAPRPAALWAGLAAAAFFGGVILGPILERGDGFAANPGGSKTGPVLTRVLDERLAADGADGDGLSVGLTYRDTQGRWCRTFNAREAALAGLACRQDGAWRLRALAPLDGQDGEARMATTETPVLILDAVDAGLAGETLDAQGERDARDSGWR